MPLHSPELKPDPELLQRFGPQIAGALQALSLLPVGGIDAEIPDLIRLKPNQVVYKTLEDVLAHAKPGPDSKIKTITRASDEPLRKALEALSKRYPRLTRAVSSWGIGGMPSSHVIAETMHDPAELSRIPKVKISENYQNQIQRLTGLKGNSPEAIYPMLEHELTHVAQFWAMAKKLNKLFGLPEEENELLEPTAYARQGKRITGFGGFDEGMPRSVQNRISALKK